MSIVRNRNTGATATAADNDDDDDDDNGDVCLLPVSSDVHQISCKNVVKLTIFQLKF